MPPLRSCRASTVFAWCPPVYALKAALRGQYHRMRFYFQECAIETQTPGPLGDPGVLRDDCSSAPLDACCVPLSRVASSFRHRPQGAARRKDCKLCRGAVACHLHKQRAAGFGHTLWLPGHIELGIQPHCALLLSALGHRLHGPLEASEVARFPLFSAGSEGESFGRADRQPQADAACRAGPPDGGGDLRLAADRVPGPQEDRADRPRGAGSRGCDRDADADDPGGGPVARERPLRRLRAGNAADSRPSRSRDALRSDQ